MIKYLKKDTWGWKLDFSGGDCAEATIVYQDYGISGGMEKGIKRAEEKGRKVEYRTIGKN